MTMSLNTSLPAEHPYYLSIMKSVHQAQSDGDHQRLSFLRGGVQLALKCNDAWKMILEHTGGQLLGLELSDMHGERFAVLLEDASEPGRYRAQYYDARGFSGHATRDTLQAVLEEIVLDGYRVPAPGAMQRLCQTHEWAMGTFVTHLIDKVNAGQLTYQAMHEELAKEEARLSA